MATPAASSTAASAAATTMAASALPAKYAAAGMGVPASRFSPPLSRSAAIPAPMLMNVADMMPLAMMPAAKYCRNGTPVCPILPWNTSPNTSSRMTGKENVKITASPLAEERPAPPARPGQALTRSTEGSGAAGSRGNRLGTH